MILNACMCLLQIPKDNYSLTATKAIELWESHGSMLAPDLTLSRRDSVNSSTKWNPHVLSPACMVFELLGKNAGQFVWTLPFTRTRVQLVMRLGWLDCFSEFESTVLAEFTECLPPNATYTCTPRPQECDHLLYQVWFRMPLVWELYRLHVSDNRGHALQPYARL